MNGAPDQNTENSDGCVVRAVAEALTRNPRLEAVTIDRAREEVSVATMGQVADDQLAGQVTSIVQASAGPASHCGLLNGTGTCASCDRPLPAELSRRVEVRQEAGQTTIARVTCPTAPRFWRWRRLRLPRVAQRDVAFTPDDEHSPDEWKWQLAAAGVCGVAALVAGMAPPGAARYVLHAVAYLAGGWFAVGETWERLRKAELDVHFLMLAVAAGSAAIGNWSEGATLLFLFALSGGLEHFALARTRREIESLFKVAPRTATRLDASGNEEEVPVESLQKGMRLLVKPGALFPVDVEIVKGATAADESNLTGEAMPVDKAVGDTGLSGTINLWGAVEALVLRPASESALQQIIRLIREAQHQKAPSQRFTDRFSMYYTYAVLAGTLVMFLVWWLGMGLLPWHDAPGGVRSAFYRAMTLLVVASPCALVLSIPSAVLAAIAWGARHGVLFRGGAAVEKLAEVTVVALDKTGTLTTGELRVEKVESLPPGNEAAIARLAYSMEKLSSHPLARAITRHGRQQGLETLPLQEFSSVTGQGLLARLDGRECRLGRREFVRPEGGSGPEFDAAAPGLSEIWVSDGSILGRLVLRDDVRPEAGPALESMRAMGLRTVLLTGDRPAAAARLLQEVSLDEVRAGLKPEDKVAAIRELSAGGRRVAMVGDGVNDAPSLATAHVGVAMGARGADAALEQADLILLHDRIENFVAAYRLSQRARAVIRQNMAISLGTVAVLISFALAGAIPLTVGVIGHEGSTVVVVMNSLRLLLGRLPSRA